MAESQLVVRAPGGRGVVLDKDEPRRDCQVVRARRSGSKFLHGRGFEPYGASCHATCFRGVTCWRCRACWGYCLSCLIFGA